MTKPDAFRLHKVINEPDFLPLLIVRLLADALLVPFRSNGDPVTRSRRRLHLPRKIASLWARHFLSDNHL